MSMTDLCQELKNWFDRGQKKIKGEFVIVNNAVFLKNGDILKPLSECGMLDGQYYRVIGSVFADGVHKYGDLQDSLRDETFSGAVWFMAVPPAVVSLNTEIDAWVDKYGEVVNSPYTSESFSGYSYTKGGGVSASGGNGNTWQNTYKSRLNKWRKI